MTNSKADRLLWLALLCLVGAELLDSCSGLLPPLQTSARPREKAHGATILNPEARMGDRGFSSKPPPGSHTVWCSLAQRHKTESWRFRFVEREKGPNSGPFGSRFRSLDRAGSLGFEAFEPHPIEFQPSEFNARPYIWLHHTVCANRPSGRLNPPSPRSRFG